MKSEQNLEYSLFLICLKSKWIVIASRLPISLVSEKLPFIAESFIFQIIVYKFFFN